MFLNKINSTKKGNDLTRLKEYLQNKGKNSVFCYLRRSSSSKSDDNTQLFKLIKKQPVLNI
jgi:hypothetical protein